MKEKGRAEREIGGLNIELVAVFTGELFTRESFFILNAKRRIVDDHRIEPVSRDQWPNVSREVSKYAEYPHTALLIGRFQVPIGRWPHPGRFILIYMPRDGATKRANSSAKSRYSECSPNFTDYLKILAR